jgi:hypothetical protein
MTIIELIIGFVVPTLIIPVLAPTEDIVQEVLNKLPLHYFLTGVMVGGIVIITGFFFFKYGILEDRHPDTEYGLEPRLRDMLHDTLSNG